MSPKQKRILQTAGIAVEVAVGILALVGMVWGAAVVVSAATTDNAVINKALGDHEERIKQVEDTTLVIATDVRWIRNTMEKEHP